ncbi:molybdopterin converting factor subunit 1 [uncultured Rubinisphaera sp.]|uniref:molybdopterin converting factor subunit 1 n=1 Tax=uncultured Rubinisphaera sp. TaxID=1678686 RepID=UPI0030DB68B8
MNNTSTITIRLFATLREIVGQDQLTFLWHDGLTIAELKQTLLQTYPELEPQFKAIMMARNGSYCKEAQVLQPDDEIAFIPPVSGG